MNNYKLIAFEPISENEIANYTYEGVENQEKPLNPNEEFVQLTNKIDFKKLNGKSLDYTSPDYQFMDDEAESIETHQLNVTENLKKHIATTLEELNALIDILQIVKDNTYMQLKKFVKESHEDNVNSYIAAKKIGLAASAATLLNSTVRLSKTLSSVRDQNQQNSFYSELANLRREWRIKWFQKHLIGDLSLTSCGSTFLENGAFQIIEELEDGAMDGRHELDLQNLRIVLMNNQEGEPILKIKLNEDGSESSEYNAFIELPEARECKLQVEKLNRAQNLLFLQEIFYTMCWESRLLNCPVLVKENRLVVNLRGMMNLEIDFLILPEKHWFGYNDKVTEELTTKRLQNEMTINQYNLFSDAMVTFMRDLMREKHRSSAVSHFSLASPMVGPVQIAANRRYRGTQFYRAIDYSPAEQCNVVFLLPSLLDSVAFFRARSDVLSVLDEVAASCTGSISLFSHVQATQSIVSCNISFIISCMTYTSLLHYFTLSLTVSKGTVYLNIVSDHVKHNLVYETIDIDILRSFFQCQIWNFKIDVIGKLATIKHNWQLVDFRLTNSQKTLQQDVHVGVIVLSKNGQWLLNFAGETISTNYQMTVTYSRVENHCPVEWKRINLPQIQRKLIKSDLEAIDVLFTALY